MDAGVLALAPHSHPNDAIRERRLHHIIAAQRLRKHCLSDPTHSFKRRKRNCSISIFRNQCFAQTANCSRPMKIVGYLERSSDVYNASPTVFRLERRSIARVYVGHQLWDLGGIFAPVPGFEIQGNIRMGLQADRDDALAQPERAHLFSAAYLTLIGANGQESNEDIAGIDGLLDLSRPTRSPLDSFRVHPNYEAVALQLALETEGSVSSVLAGVGQEDHGASSIL